MKSVSITGFKTSHTAFTCSKESSMLYLFQRVIRNRCEIDTNRASITNLGKSYYKSGQFQLLQIGAKLLQIGAVIISWGRYYKLWQPFQIGAEHAVCGTK